MVWDSSLKRCPKSTQDIPYRDNGGYLTVEAYFPEADIFYLIFANRPDWPREKTYEQVDSILHANRLI